MALHCDFFKPTFEYLKVIKVYCKTYTILKFVTIAKFIRYIKTTCHVRDYNSGTLHKFCTKFTCLYLACIFLYTARNAQVAASLL